MRVVRLASGVVVAWVAALSLLCAVVVIASLVLEVAGSNGCWGGGYGICRRVDVVGGGLHVMCAPLAES